MLYTVPGDVSDLTGQPQFTTIMLTWSAPQEPNRVIISYEVTYRVSDGNLLTTNTTDLRFTISSLTPGTNVTEISVSAYTSAGRGDPVQIPRLLTTSPRGCLYNYNAYQGLIQGRGWNGCLVTPYEFEMSTETIITAQSSHEGQALKTVHTV